MLRLKTGRKISPETLYTWQRRYRAEGRAGLVDRRWLPNADDEAADENSTKFVREEVLRFWQNENQPALTLCYDLALQIAKEKGWKTCSNGTCYRAAKALSKATVLLKRNGEKAFADGAEPYLERDYTTLESNEVWVGDHHQFDVMVRAVDGKIVRPWLTAWLDARSRRIVGWQIFAHAPNSDTILRAFGSAVKVFGVPEVVYTDNGKDYDCRALTGRTKRERLAARGTEAAGTMSPGGIFGELGVKHVFAIPFSFRSKPIERAFGTVCGRFSKLFTTYCGNKPGNRPQGLQSRIDAGHAKTLEESTADFAQWLDGEYHLRPHAGDGMNAKGPAAVYDENLHKRNDAPGLLLQFLLRKTKRRTVHQNGVTVFPKHTYGRSEPALHRLLGEQVIVRIDPEDITSVSVWTLDGRHLCEAQSNRRLPFRSTLQELRVATAETQKARGAQPVRSAPADARGSDRRDEPAQFGRPPRGGSAAD